MLLVRVVGLLAAVAVVATDDNEDDAGEYLVPDRASDLGEVFRDEDHDMKYVFMDVKAPWNEAQLICQARNSYLAMPSTVEKLKFIGIALAESFIVNRNLWVGGKVIGNVSKWVDSGEEINANSNNTEWAERPSHIADLDKRTCVSIYRRKHNIPVLATLDCNLHRPFICESHMDNTTTKPRDTKHSENINGIRYTLHHADVTWKGALTFCRQHKKLLATFKDLNEIRRMSRYMLWFRPVVENAWIGASYNAEADNWMWVKDSSVIPDKMDSETKYPPWYNHNVTKKSGCVLLDRHLCNDTVFVPEYCERKRAVICMDETVEASSTFTRPGGNGSKYFLSTIGRTWQDAFKTCQELFDGGSLVVVKTQEELETIVDLMSINNDEINHIWLNGRLDYSRKKFTWENEVGQNADIDFSKFSTGVMCDNTTDYDVKMSCLNLDRENHNHPMMYGLPCSNRQRFICFSPKGTPPTLNGTDQMPTAAATTWAPTTTPETSPPTTKEAPTTTTTEAPTTTTEAPTTTTEAQRTTTTEAQRTTTIKMSGH